MPKSKLRIKWEQVAENTAAFTVVVHTPGDTYWDIRLHDFIDTGHAGASVGLHFHARHKVATAQAIANKAAGELNEVRGLIYLVKVVDGIPLATFAYVSNGRQVYPIRSTDHNEVVPVHPTVLRAMGSGQWSCEELQIIHRHCKRRDERRGLNICGE